MVQLPKDVTAFMLQNVKKQRTILKDFQWLEIKHVVFIDLCLW